jgi:hypothetical protein
MANLPLNPLARWIAAIGLCVPLAVSAATEQEEAVTLCEGKLREMYDLEKFTSVWADPVGNHKFNISGNVREQDRNYPFECQVTNGRVKSYSYRGPSAHAQEGSGVGTAIAVGAGLAVAAAITAAALDDDDDEKKQKSGKSKLEELKTVLEDACHDALEYRIRDEQYNGAEVKMASSKLDGHQLAGKGKVKHANGLHHVEYTCYFDQRGRVIDSKYHLY